MLEAILIFLLSAVIAEGYWAINRLAQKVRFYEQYITDMKDRIGVAHAIMKQADIRGSFEADDEVGDAFKTIKQAIEELNGFVREE